MIRIAFVTTSPLSARYLMAGQLADLRAHGFEVTVLCAGGEDLDVVARREGVDVVAIPIARDIAPFADLRAIWRLIRALRRVRPALVNFGTPKGALLGAIASAIVRVPVRIHVLRGLRSETTRGLKRFLLERLEWLTAALSHRIVCVSPSLRDAFVARGLASAKKIVVLGRGSSNGVDAARFARNAEARTRIRGELGAGENDVLIGFIGRLTRDKGIGDLLAAFRIVLERAPRARLLLIGDAEVGDPVEASTLRELETHPRITRLALVEDIAAHYSAIDMLVLPSYREGFPNVVLEAAAASIPVVGYRATGIVDAIEDGVTGALVSPGDVPALAAAITQYVLDGELRQRHGDAGRRRVETSFTREEIWRRLRELYDDELRRAGIIRSQ